TYRQLQEILSLARDHYPGCISGTMVGTSWPYNHPQLDEERRRIRINQVRLEEVIDSSGSVRAVTSTKISYQSNRNIVKFGSKTNRWNSLESLIGHGPDEQPPYIM